VAVSRMKNNLEAVGFANGLEKYLLIYVEWEDKTKDVMCIRA